MEIFKELFGLALPGRVGKSPHRNPNALRRLPKNAEDTKGFCDRAYGHLA